MEASLKNQLVNMIFQSTLVLLLFKGHKDAKIVDSNIQFCIDEAPLAISFSVDEDRKVSIVRLFDPTRAHTIATYEAGLPMDKLLEAANFYVCNLRMEE